MRAFLQTDRRGSRVVSRPTIVYIMPTRRQFLGCVAAGNLYPRFGFSASKPLRGIIIILATPYADNKAIDYEDLAA
jgi:hypothetical protein